MRQKSSRCKRNRCRHGEKQCVGEKEKGKKRKNIAYRHKMGRNRCENVRQRGETGRKTVRKVLIYKKKSRKREEKWRSGEIMIQRRRYTSMFRLSFTSQGKGTKGRKKREKYSVNEKAGYRGWFMFPASFLFRKNSEKVRNYVSHRLFITACLLSVLYNLLRKVFSERLHFAAHYSSRKRSRRAQMGTEKKQDDTAYFKRIKN